MAQAFNGVVLTSDGSALLAKAQAGECTIQFTRMALGNGSYTDYEKTTSSLRAMTALRSEKNSYSLSSVSVYSDTSVKVSALLSNYDISTSESLVDEEYYINEIGLYAQEDDDADTEILYSIAVVSADEGDIMPAYTGSNPIQIIQTYYVTVDSGGDATFEGSGAIALDADLETLREELLGYINALNETAVLSEDVRRIEKVSELPEEPVETTMYLIS